MQDFIKKLFHSRLFLFFCAIALVALTLAVFRESYQRHLLTQEINQLEAEIERVEGKNRQLADLIEYFKQDSYLEKEARLKLNLKKPDEKVIIISRLNQEGAPAVAVSSADGQVSNQSVEANQWKWWRYFFSR